MSTAEPRLDSEACKPEIAVQNPTVIAQRTLDGLHLQ